ncbi:OLC1v1025232C1 [Oldenlandia corymbosa var. corymbosa]|uniref:OLC1v1025232C1 n=1 Tax=Oldenlandia corymbosa var. corymbosa TaxID=529605 RepID=A0AAV1C4S4_OLDCO|nr:OLC1v1025232C1 [Oldenlandia corymbosa var. corymbosa]
MSTLSSTDVVMINLEFVDDADVKLEDVKVDGDGQSTLTSSNDSKEAKRATLSLYLNKRHSSQEIVPKKYSRTTVKILSVGLG